MVTFEDFPRTAPRSSMPFIRRKCWRISSPSAPWRDISKSAREGVEGKVEVGGGRERKREREEFIDNQIDD